MTDEKNQEELKQLIALYEQRVFALALYLVGGDRNKTYDVASDAFSEAVRKSRSLIPDDSFLAVAAAAVVERSRETKAMPSPDELDWPDAAEPEKGILRIVSRALQALTFQEKMLVLLRDQLNLPYKYIAAIACTNEKDAQMQTLQARSRLRKKIEDWTHGRE